MTTNPHHEQTVVAVVGPTAAGKTALAETMARRMGGEMVSADSMQVYRGLDIGTAKPVKRDRAMPYHCLDLVDPDEPFSAALYQRAAREAIESCRLRSVLPVLCGGTGLYVRAALDDLEFPVGEQTNNALRARYESLAAEQGADALHELLRARDGASAALIHPHNVRRVVRALEMADSGVSYAEHHAGLKVRTSIYDARFLGVTVERERLYLRIRERVDEMLARGLLDEVRSLLEAGYRSALTAAQAIGYKELVAHLDGETTLEEAVEHIKRASTRYAKRQLTWFRADPRIVWIDVTDLSPDDQLTAALEALHLEPCDPTSA